MELGPARKLQAVARQQGAGLRTVKQWAKDFDWKGRVKTHDAQTLQRYVEVEEAVTRQQMLGVAERAAAFRHKELDLAQELLDAAQRFFERMDDADFDQMSFADACKAVEVASRIARLSAKDGPDTRQPAADRTFRDEIQTALDKAYGSPKQSASSQDRPPALPK